MTPDITSAAMTAVQSGTVKAPTLGAGADAVRAKKVAQEFEGVFVAQMLGHMFEGISTDGPFGGGQGEAMFRSLLMEEYGKEVAAQGGFGIANQVTAELLKHQEAAQAGAGGTLAGTATGVKAASAYGNQGTVQ